MRGPFGKRRVALDDFSGGELFAAARIDDTGR